MKSFALLTAVERRTAVNAAANRLGMPEVVIEKDFWVCWLLARIFATKGLGSDCVFKGGTSLSKVFGAVNRFSEDVDLSIHPALLGFKERDLDEAASASSRRKKIARLEEQCKDSVSGQFRKELEQEVRSVIGAPASGDWLTFEVDPRTQSPVLHFAYPDPSGEAGGYVAQRVKLEFGSLTDQRPDGRHRVEAFLAQALPGIFDDLGADVVALELERTFWEKATILHAEYHRPPGKQIRDRFARHYSDFAALWNSPSGRQAAKQLDLLERVRLHKSRYFSSAWANYEEAVPGTIRLVPPKAREAELRKDYESMRPMFLVDPPGFAVILSVLEEAERSLNRG
ncbi:MAG: hypothetical protein FD180_378 [Planctomycetota bacterium]|nr:MAG: hypothetical protein FD180_378 [Planctomycetota bacterium]